MELTEHELFRCDAYVNIALDDYRSFISVARRENDARCADRERFLP